MVNLSKKHNPSFSSRGEWPGQVVSSDEMLDNLQRCEKLLEVENPRFHYLFDQPCLPGRERHSYILRMIFILNGNLSMTAAYDRNIAQKTIHTGEIAVGGRGNWNASTAGENPLCENYSVIFLHNLIRLVHSYTGEDGKCRTSYCHYPPPGEQLRKLLDCANEVIADINNARSKRIRLLLGAILEQFRIDIADNAPRVPKLPEIVSRAIHYIDLNYAMSINCSSVAEALQINRTQLSELFHQAVNMTVKDYILNLRLEKARWLLEYPDRKIADIAQECGFASAGYFIKVFRKKYTTTPQQYRTGKLK
ncbi:MAG: helix-turn-helix transcriptional regulator [Lentisphaeria bacterium]|nr:helix-turn-helix transcriptional regulator [Lentisphaeria bacterium]